MFNSGIRGKRASDNTGTVASQSQFIQQKYPQPSITGYSIVGTDDTALNTAGGQTVLVNGTGFASGAAVTVNGITISPVTVVSPTQLSFTSTALAGGSYTLIVYNSTGGAAILVPGLIYSAVPTWTTSAGSIGTYYETIAINSNVVATSDSAITYSLSSGSLPSGATLYGNGVITGTSPVESGSTTYTFAIKAEDQELQDTTRTFTLTINTDVVTWSAPANGTTYTANINEVASNVVLSATSAAGYGITYSANTLPTGLSLSGNTISGTPTVVGSSATLLTATASTTNRNATRTINWVIQLGSDPFFYSTTLLLNGETSSTYWIQDASTNGFAVTVNGDTRPTAFSPYETVWSGQFDGTNDYISTPANSAFSFGTGDFTIECFIKTADNSLAPGGYSRSIMYIGDFDFYLRITAFHGGTDGALRVAGLSDGSTVSLKDDLWHHIAIVRESNIIRLWIDGIYQTSGSGTTYSTNHTNVDTNVVGGRANPIAGYFNGYISNVRVVKGTAVYTGTNNFRVPTSPLTAITGTSLLTCARNRFIDASTNALAITVNDAPIISNFAPLIETDVVTGSGYFDGTGDFLNAGNQTPYGFGTGDFTVECWIYATAASDSPIYEGRANGSGSDGFTITAFSSSVIRIFSGSVLISSSSTTYLNQWTHVAVCRVSGTTTLYINGTSAGTSASLGNNATGSAVIGGGRYGGGTTVNSSFSGYISNFRIVKGTAVYTSAFTPPTSPLTAIANTSLLTLQSRIGETNNRFVDNSVINNFITRNGNTTQGTFSPYSQTGWSNYLDGNGDGLTLSANTAFVFGTGDFTIEFWFNGPSQTNTFFYDNRGGTDSGYPIVTTGSTTSGLRWGPTNTSTTAIIGDNQWHHCAITRQSNTVRLFVDGVLDKTVTDSVNYSVSYGVCIGYNSYGGNNLTGYLSNFRIIKGTALYTAGFTPSTNPLTAIAGTSLLTCQSNRLIDNSANNFTITRNGDTSVQSFSPFAPAITTPTSYSAFFDGSGDFLTVPDNSNFGYGTGDFTIEFWLYPNSTGLQTVVSNLTSASSTNPHLYISSSIRYYTASADRITGASLVTGVWYHVALCRASGSTRLFVNGTQSGSTYTDANNYGSSAPFGIGTYWNGGTPVGDNTLSGYISNVRILKGTGLYTTTFTPPTTPLTAIANTSLLTCQSNTFIDNSTNNFTITANGDAASRSFNPFGNTSLTGSNAAYSITNVGGGMYFDGSGDYLTAPDNVALESFNDFTIEFWVYFNSVSGTQVILDKGWNNASVAPYLIFQTDGAMVVYASSNGSSWDVIGGSNLGTLSTGQWHHLAVTRSGSAIRLFRNGTIANSLSNSSTIWNSTSALGIGGSPMTGANPLNGYLSGVRIVKGTAIYTSRFVPPVAPVTPVANTTLLLSGANSGLIDYASKNILETVGNTQLSAVVKKFGSSSMYFDGTGDYLTIRNSQNFVFGSGNWTIELWVYLNSTSRQGFVAFGNAGGTNVPWEIGVGSAGKFRLLVQTAGGQTVLDGITNPTTGVWYHIAGVRNGSTATLYVNGTSEASSSSLITNSLTDESNAVQVGRYSYGFELNGYIDDLRITKGIARYTSNFTVPSSAFSTF